MTQARIRRGGSSRLLVEKPVKERPRRRNARRKSALDRWLARLPLGAAALHRILSWGIVALVILALWGVARFFGLPAMAHMELAEWAARAGYEVEKVEVHGTERMDEMAVYAIALGQVDRSMLNVDLGAVRDEIMHLPWVSDARISRRLPDTLVVDIVERKPAAVWQHQGRLALIDASGAVLEPVSPVAMPDLPLLVGTDANGQAERLARLMEAAPALKPLLAGATWVGNRRWDLRFQSGETLLLPEGDAQAASALVTFARLDGINRLLGRGIARFDMRDPDKFILRLPKDAAAARLKDGVAPAAVAPAAVEKGPVRDEAEEKEKGAAAGEGQG